MAEKRKGLMSQIADYQREERQKRTYATKAKPKLSAKAAKAKVDTKKTYSYNKRLDQSLGARNGKKSQSMKDRRDESKGAEKAAGRPAYSGNKSSTQGTTSTPSKSGTYGKSLPSNPKLKNVTMAPRKKRPGTGRTGAAAAKAANRAGPQPKNKHKETKRKVNRRGRRV
jgi:hypothetical protein